MARKKVQKGKTVAPSSSGGTPTSSSTSSKRTNKKKEASCAWVVVLGDAGRSPRMQYHALSLCETGQYQHVHMIGYRGARLIPELEDACAGGKLVTSYIPTTPAWMNATSMVHKVFKAVFQALVLFRMLCIQLPRPDVILVQIPPAIPTMALCIFVAWMRRARLIFDWHNFAHTLMMGGILSKISRVYEKMFAPYADGNLCVTRAMKKVLQAEYRGTQATVFYDAPPRLFRGRASSEEKEELFKTLHPCLLEPMHAHDCLASMIHDGILKGGDDMFLSPHKTTRQHRVLVTSTSWTPDEDFGILLRAMVEYDALARTRDLPTLVLFVTGRGPQKDMFVQRMQSLDLRKVAIRTVWLEPKDYPVLLGSADVGISLHASSSGVDLPMKIVDMFGSHLPVCALSYPCLAEEMVRDGKNGLLFSTSSELVGSLLDLFENDRVSVMMEYIKRHPHHGHWDDAWQTHAWPVISGTTNA